MAKKKKSSDDLLVGPKYRLRLGPFFRMAHPDEVAYSWVSYDIARYFFELARNLLILGALRFAADSTGNIFLNLIFYIAIGFFVMFVYSFLCFWNLSVFSSLLRKSSAGPAVDAVLTLLISVALTLPLFGLIIYVTGQMAGVRQ